MKHWCFLQDLLSCRIVRKVLTCFDIKSATYSLNRCRLTTVSSFRRPCNTQCKSSLGVSKLFCSRAIKATKKQSRDPDILGNVIASGNVHIFRKHTLFSLLTMCLCGRMKSLRGPDLTRSLEPLVLSNDKRCGPENTHACRWSWPSIAWHGCNTRGRTTDQSVSVLLKLIRWARRVQ